MSQTTPTVSVVIPARNAAGSLPLALDSIARQTYPNIIEVVVAAADPGTARASRDARVVPNPSGSTPKGLNLAIEASRGEVVVRCDAHAELPPDYVSRAVETLEATGAQNVGGMQVPIGKTMWEKVIAEAMTSRLGAGYARYRVGGEPGPVETVYLGVFSRETLRRLEGFDETFARSQDYELNHRIIASGGTVWFDPGLKVSYKPRGSLGALARQYFDYGHAKAAFSRKHPGSLRLRQLIPPTTTGLVVVGIVGGFAVRQLWTIPVAYLAGLVIWSLVEPSELRSARLLKPFALAAMHLSWGSGFLAGLLRRTPED